MIRQCFKKSYLIESETFVGFAYCNEPMDAVEIVRAYLGKAELPLNTPFSVRDMSYSGFLDHEMAKDVNPFVSPLQPKNLRIVA